MANVLDVANYIIDLADSDGEPEALTCLKLQKLLYYAQGLAAAHRGSLLFSDKIKAWRDGPVVPKVWQEFKSPGSVRCTKNVVDLSIEDRMFLRQVWRTYGKYTGEELSKRTHNEPPWKNARAGLPPDASSDREITTDALLEFFSANPIELPPVPRPREIRKGREVYDIEDAGQILPHGI